MWTSEADAELVRLKKAGFSFQEVSERMDVTRNAAISRFQRIHGKTYSRKQARQPPQIRQLNVFVPGELYHRIKVRCAESEMPISNVIRALLEREFSGETTPAA